MWARRYLLIQWVCGWIVLSGRLPPGDQIKPTFGRYVNPIRSSEKYSCCFVVCWDWNSLITFVKEETCCIHLANFQHEAFSTCLKTFASFPPARQSAPTGLVAIAWLVGLTDGLDNQLPRTSKMASLPDGLYDKSNEIWSFCLHFKKKSKKFPFFPKFRMRTKKFKP